MKLKILKKYNRYLENEIVEVSEIDAANLLKRGVAEVVKKDKEAKKPSNKMEKKAKSNK